MSGGCVEGAVVGEAAEKRREALHLGLEEMLHAEAKELFSIDADTSARQFRKEVQWSAAYRTLVGAV